MNISKIMSSLAILLVLLTGCSQSSKHTKGDNVDQQGNAYRIVPTTVALTMTLDKLDILLSESQRHIKHCLSVIKTCQKLGNRCNQVWKQ